MLARTPAGDARAHEQDESRPRPARKKKAHRGRPLRGGVSGAAPDGPTGPRGAHDPPGARRTRRGRAPGKLTFSAGACGRARSPTAAHARERDDSRRRSGRERLPPCRMGRRGGIWDHAPPRGRPQGDAGARRGSGPTGRKIPPVAVDDSTAGGGRARDDGPIVSGLYRHIPTPRE